MWIWRHIFPLYQANCAIDNKWQKGEYSDMIFRTRGAINSIILLFMLCVLLSYITQNLSLKWIYSGNFLNKRALFNQQNTIMDAEDIFITEFVNVFANDHASLINIYIHKWLSCRNELKFSFICEAKPHRVRTSILCLETSELWLK